jgi:hypothetical protein
VIWELELEAGSYAIFSPVREKDGSPSPQVPGPFRISFSLLNSYQAYAISEVNKRGNGYDYEHWYYYHLPSTNRHTQPLPTNSQLTHLSLHLLREMRFPLEKLELAAI